MRRTIAVTLSAATLVAAGAPAAPAQKPPNPWPALGVSCQTRGTAGAAYRIGNNCRHIRHQRYPRRFVAYVSKKAAGKMLQRRRVPVVVMLHGSRQTGEEHLENSGWKEKADEVGLIAVFPTGLTYTVTNEGSPRQSTKWSSFDLPTEIDTEAPPPGWVAGLDDFPPDDVGFLRKVINDVKARLRIQPNRVYVSGFSDGGQMCTRVGIELSDLVAAVGCNAAFIDAFHELPPGGRYVPTFLTLGSLDDLAVAKLQEIDATATEIPLDPTQIVNVFGGNLFANSLQSAGLAAEPYLAVSRPRNDPDLTELIWTTPLSHNTSGNRLHFLVLDGVTHNYPHGQRNGNPRRFVMTDRLWPFFENNPRP